MTKPLLLIFLCLGLAACWNGENVHVRMGDVSLGQQLIDLKTALDSEALTEEEYERTKQRLLALASLCEDSDEEARHNHRRRDHQDDEDDDGFNWF